MKRVRLKPVSRLSTVLASLLFLFGNKLLHRDRVRLILGEPRGSVVSRGADVGFGLEGGGQILLRKPCRGT